MTTQLLRTTVRRTVLGSVELCASANMSKPKVLMTRSDVPEIAIRKLQEKCDLDVYEGHHPIPRDIFLRRVAGVDGVFCVHTDTIDQDLIEAAGPSLKTICTMSVGYDHINLDLLKQKGIKVGYTPDVLTDATAELTVALLLATTRRLFEARKELDTGGWLKCSWSPMFMHGRSVAGSTVGIFGLGRIGQAVLKRLAGFNVARFIYNSASKKDLGKDLPAASYVSFEDLLKESDFIICTAALNPNTKNIFNKAAFTAMKKTAVFVNTSRGGLVDQDALIWALQSGEIYAAGLDVMTPEPLPVDHVLTTLPNCTLLPHIGSAEVQTRSDMAELTADNLIGCLIGGGMRKQLC